MDQILERVARHEFYCKKVFVQLKNMFISAPIIQPPDRSLSFEIMYDASEYVVGAVLGQRQDKKPCHLLCK